MKGASTNTVNPATETFGQARQGSVAAIIQVLNERLADIGIRTRAVVADGMLQLLCEATTAEALEKEKVVERVRTELETISPQRIKKVKINSRIVKEEQLLWLEEINRDPENNLLWAEVITLKRPFFVQRWIRDRDLKPAGPIFRDITEPEPTKTSLPSKLIGGISLALLVAAAAWLFRDDFGRNQPVVDVDGSPITAEDEAPSENTFPIVPSAPVDAESEGDRTADTTPTDALEPEEPTPAQVPSTGTNSTLTPDQTPDQTPESTAGNSGSVTDAFAEAVRVAEQAAIDGQTASTAAEWLDLAARWQKASDLMSNIPEGNPQYAVAQNRLMRYQENSQSALQKATNVQSP